MKNELPKNACVGGYNSEALVIIFKKAEERGHYWSDLMLLSIVLEPARQYCGHWTGTVSYYS